MNFSNLQNFMNNEFPIAIAAFFCFIAIGAWRKSDWIKFGSALLFSTIIIAVAKGADIWAFVKTILRWFGLNL